MTWDEVVLWIFAVTAGGVLAALLSDGLRSRRWRLHWYPALRRGVCSRWQRLCARWKANRDGGSWF